MRLLRIVSLLVCTIVVLSFALFVVEQTKSASGHQQQLLGAGPPSSTSSSGQPASTGTHARKSTPHRLLDEASTQLTSPFAGVVAGTHSEWVSRGGKLLLALAVYGFGFGFVARVLTVRV